MGLAVRELTRKQIKEKKERPWGPFGKKKEAPKPWGIDWNKRKK